MSANKDKELEDPKGFTGIEYTYSLMAHAAGIAMGECRLLEERGQRHFMARRFDRLEDGGKLHMQSLAALAHFDFNAAAIYSYEQAFDVMKRLELPMANREEPFRRLVSTNLSASFASERRVRVWTTRHHSRHSAA